MTSFRYSFNQGLIQEHSILPRSKVCDVCSLEMAVYSNKDQYYYFQCRKCKTKQSLRRGTILNMANISFRKFILLAYIFVNNLWSYKQVCTEVGVTSSEEEEEGENVSKKGSVLSSRTISRYYTVFR